jgi:hypothetical protein
MAYIDEIALFEDKEHTNRWLSHAGYKVLWRWHTPDQSQVVVQVQHNESGRQGKGTASSTLVALCAAIMDAGGREVLGPVSRTGFGGWASEVRRCVFALEGPAE